MYHVEFVFLLGTVTKRYGTRLVPSEETLPLAPSTSPPANKTGKYLCT